MTSPLINHRSREASAALPRVESFFQLVAAQLRARLVNRSAADVPVRVSGVEVRTLGALHREPEFAGGCVLGELRLGSGMPTGIVVIQHNLLTRLIAVLLGEGLEESNELSQFRALTPVERRIAGRICEDLVAGIGSCWPGTAKPECCFGGLVSPAVLTDPMVSGSSVYTAMLDFGPAGSALGLMAVAIPVSALSGSETSRTEAAPKRRESSLASVMPVELEVVVELTRIKLTVNRLRSLEVGEVVPLGSLRDAVVKVNGMPLFEGQAGVSGGARSVKLVRRRKG